MKLFDFCYGCFGHKIARFLIYEDIAYPSEHSQENPVNILRKYSVGNVCTMMFIVDQVPSNVVCIHYTVYTCCVIDDVFSQKIHCILL